MKRTRWVVAVGLVLIVAGLGISQAVREAARRPVVSQDERIATMRYDKAVELLAIREYERGVKMLENVIDQFPESKARTRAHLALGRHFLNRGQHSKALANFRPLWRLKKTGQEIKGDEKEMYLESLYLGGVAYFQTRQYSSAFPMLRRITSSYPNTIWANQAYYYIGMCHFAQENWNKAIESLALVGTFVDPDSPSTQYVEAGHRFYVKVADADLPILHRLGETTYVTIRTESGDSEKVQCKPLSMKTAVFIAAVGTDIAPPAPNDGILQVAGGDTIVTTYVDDNTKDGRKGLDRTRTTRVVSTASLAFTLGTYESKAEAAFLNQPLFVALRDVDLDVSPKAETAYVRLISRYRAEDQAMEETGLGDDLTYREADLYKTRDEVTLKLSELGESPVHTGKFTGRILITPTPKDKAVDRTDDLLHCSLGDEIIATYEDRLHIGGESPRESKVSIKVIGEIDASPRATQNLVADPVLKAKKNIVEATAYLELARIFRSMGLMDGARSKASEGLSRVEEIIRIEGPIPQSLSEEAFKLKWQLHESVEDYEAAIATCRVFSQLFPDSAFVDEALLGIGNARINNKEYAEAIRVFQQILELEKSRAKAEAQFRIAQAYEKIEGEGSEKAIRAFRECSKRYPDTEFAGPSLARQVDYFINTKDYRQAEDLLQQIFQDYPDATFLDQMLAKWGVLAYRRGDLKQAHEKWTQLLFEYPSSEHAPNAKKWAEAVQQRMNSQKGAE